MLFQILMFGGGAVLGIKNQRYLENRKLIKNALQKKQPPKQKASGLHQIRNTSLLAVKKVFSISMRNGELRHQQLKQISTADDNQTNRIEKKVDKNIKISLGLMGICLIGISFYTPFLPIAALGSLYTSKPVFQKLIISFLITGHFFLATLVSFLSLINLKLLMRTEAHSQKQLTKIFNQKQQPVWIIKEGTEVEIPLEDIKTKDIVVVNAGEIIPVDGFITRGIARVDQHSLTGGSQPVDKNLGGKVLATTLVLSGRILIQVEHSGSNTNAATIGHILQHTQKYKETLRIRGKHIADGFSAPTLLVSVATLPLFGPSAAMAILWSGFGYNMKSVGPISVLNFLHIMAKNGILIKNGRSLEMLQKVDTVVFDTTGTLTMEQPQLSQLHPLHPYDKDTLLTYAAIAEYRQTHVIGKAILSAAKLRGLKFTESEETKYKAGYGIEVKIGTSVVQVGSAHFMKKNGAQLPNKIQQLKTRCDTNGNSLVYIAVDDHLAGVLEFKPSIHPKSKEIISYLKAQEISPIIISSDPEQPTHLLAKELGIDNYYAETLPEKKAELIKGLRERGKFVAYIGDGINDAIALKQANVSISFRGVSTVATDTAQIVLMDGDLNKLKSLFEISNSFKTNMKTNFLGSMIPGAITLTGVFFLHMGLVGSLVVYFSSKAAGLMNTMLPLVKYENSDNLTKKDHVLPLITARKQ